MNSYLESCPFTLNTTRICATNHIDISIEVSRCVFTNMKPNVIILVNENEIFDSIAATPLVHHPINASLLFTNGNILSKETLNEIKRLSPKGYEGIHVILVGNISKNISSELNDYGFRTHHISGISHYETASMIPSARKEFKNILIISGEDYSEGIIASYWSTHHGDPILYVQKNNIPNCTLEAIRKMYDINIYIIGSTKTVSRSVEKILSKLDNVKRLKRIEGNTAYEIAVNFSKYKDSKTEFGWDRNNREGHAFTFGNLNYPMEITAGALFAHMGKHTPLLLTKKDMLPIVIKRYIKSVKPMISKDMIKPPFMHGFILGDMQNISNDTQLMIESTLSIDTEIMHMEHDMNDSNHMKHMDHAMNETDYIMNIKHYMYDSDQKMEMEDHMHYSDQKMEMEMENHMHDSDQKMEMKNHMHDSDHKMGMENHMYDSDYKMGMENDMYDSDQKMEMGNHMNDSDHEMEMDYDMYNLDNINVVNNDICNSYEIMKMNQGIYDSDSIMDTKNDIQDSYKMMKMNHGVYDSDNIMDINQGIYYSDNMMRMGNVMYHLDNMQYDEDEKYEEMIHDCNHKISGNHMFERLNSNYRRFSIDKMLD